MRNEEVEKKSLIAKLNEQITEHENKVESIREEIKNLEEEEKKKSSKLSKLLGQFKIQGKFN
ncbi:MAG: hypothetical protein MZV64_69735 [Ignavibacteriales bacterium]|nr:hypothetical protein [Ignavibacteriales bacterium]